MIVLVIVLLLLAGLFALGVGLQTLVDKLEEDQKQKRKAESTHQASTRTTTNKSRLPTGKTDEGYVRAYTDALHKSQGFKDCLVYVYPLGTVYHKDSDCANSKTKPEIMLKSRAMALGKTQCKKCWYK